MSAADQKAVHAGNYPLYAIKVGPSVKCGFLKKSFIKNVPFVSSPFPISFGWVQQQTHPKVMTKSKTVKKCSTDQRFIRKRKTAYKIGTLVGVLCGHVYSIMLRIHCVDSIKRESLQLTFHFMHTILLHCVIELDMVK